MVTLASLYRSSTHFCRCSWDALLDMVAHDGVEHAGYMAFLSLLALFPLLFFIVSLTGFFGQSYLGQEFASGLLNHLPDYAASTLQPRIDEITSGPPHGFLTIAIIGAIWTASTAVEGMRTILNRIYRIHSPPPYIWRRLLSILQFIIIVLIMMGGMLLFVFIPWMVAHSFALMHSTYALTASLSFFHSFALVMVLLFVVSMVYYLIPNIHVPFVTVLPGAFVVALGWLGIGSLIRIYLENFNQFSLIYGSLVGMIVTLLFFFIVNLVFIYGAELNYLLYTSRKGKA